MFRILFGIIASMFLFSVVKMIIGAMTREYKASNPVSSGAASAGQAPKSVGGELRKCPACGTYHAVSNLAGKTKGGELVHFCSADCRAKFAA